MHNKLWASTKKKIDYAGLVCRINDGYYNVNLDKDTTPYRKYMTEMYEKQELFKKDVAEVFDLTPNRVNSLLCIISNYMKHDYKDKDPYKICKIKELKKIVDLVRGNNV